MLQTETGHISLQTTAHTSVKCQCTLIEHIYSITRHFMSVTVSFRRNQLMHQQKNKVLFVCVTHVEPEHEM